MVGSKYKLANGYFFEWMENAKIKVDGGLIRDIISFQLLTPFLIKLPDHETICALTLLVFAVMIYIKSLLFH